MGAKERNGAREWLQRKPQRTAALRDAVARKRTPLLPQGFGVRLSSAALTSFRWQVDLTTTHSSGPPPHVGGYEIPLASNSRIV
jgi:hypothetical protein